MFDVRSSRPTRANTHFDDFLKADLLEAHRLKS